jgi:hypothetical protein
MWLEISQDSDHGGLGWAFGECLWAPAHQRNNKPGRTYWKNLLQVEAGDLVFHLRGREQREFVGYSTADSDGYSTTERPPNPGEWDYASAFFRVQLRDFVAFPDAIPLQRVFAEQGARLKEYFEQNKKRQNRETLFFTVHGGHSLRCQQGGYLTEFSSQLGAIVFGNDLVGHTSGARRAGITTRTGEVLARVKTRFGQGIFSRNVRENYGGQCCFPECQVAESYLLVGAHIARWADAEGLRGETSNGICLCLFHDRAFEKGLFTITEDLLVAVHPNRHASSPWAVNNLVPHANKPIRTGQVRPAVDSIRKHWERIEFKPRTGA